jgi:small-conductance mechanosensitive channel
MKTRRIEFNFRLHLDTPAKLAERVPSVVAEIVKEAEGASLERVDLASFDNSSLNYNVVYVVSDSDYDRYMDIQQDINLKMMAEFERLGIHLA